MVRLLSAEDEPTFGVLVSSVTAGRCYGIESKSSTECVHGNKGTCYPAKQSGALMSYFV